MRTETAEADTAARITHGKRVLIIVQNLPVPFDRRVWLECQALVAAGYEVSVVCPKGKGDPSYEVIDGVRLYKYRPYAPGGSKLSFVTEYVVLVPRHRLADAQGPPERAGSRSCRRAIRRTSSGRSPSRLRAADRTKFVFDHHDLCPELFQSRFPDGPRLPYRGLLALERRTHRDRGPRDLHQRLLSRDRYQQKRQGARRRYGRPDRARPGQAQARPAGLRNCGAAGSSSPPTSASWGRRTAWTSSCGPPTSWCARWAATTSPSRSSAPGDCFDELVALRDELKLNGHVEFTGRAPDELVKKILSTADIGLSPDPKNPLNDVSTMNKTMEYMAFELPSSPSTCGRPGSRPERRRCTSRPTTSASTRRRSST